MKKIILPAIIATAILFCAGCSSKESSKNATDKNAQEKQPATVEKIDIQNYKVEEPIFAKDRAVKDAVTESEKKAFNSNSAIETVKNMKTGWNLGNTLEATGSRTLSSETSWGQPKTTKAMIDQLAKDGMKTIRVPVSWSNHIIDSNYTIDPEWMTRVKQVADWALSDDLYVILNIHHDDWNSPGKMPRGKGFYPNKTNFEESARFISNVWAQICLAFNNGYDEHLIFEVLNEPRLKGTQYEWRYDANSPECVESAEILNVYNQIALDTIRKSGGNNLKRFVSIPGLRADCGCAMNGVFKMPQDREEGRLILSVHMYSPYNFAMESPGATEFTQKMGSELALTFKNLNENFIKKGYAVIIGEYGATNKNNLPERVKWFKWFIKYSRRYGMTSCLWDNAQWDVSNVDPKDYTEHFGFYNRTKQTWYFPEILEAIMSEVDAE